MINPQRMEWAQRLFQQLQVHFPELAMVNITESAENREHIWVNMLMPDDE